MVMLSTDTTNTATGITCIYGASKYPSLSWESYCVPYYSVSLALNIILTLMIIARVFSHSRDVQRATGTQTTAGGLYKTIVTMLIESCSLYAIAFLICMASSRNTVTNTFWPALIHVQVCAGLAFPWLDLVIENFYLILKLNRS